MREFGAGEGQSVSVEGKRGKGRSREVQIGSNGGQTQAVKYVERGDKAATGVTQSASKREFPNGDKEGHTYKVKEASEPVRESKRAKTRSSKAQVDKRQVEKCVRQSAECEFSVRVQAVRGK